MTALARPSSFVVASVLALTAATAFAVAPAPAGAATTTTARGLLAQIGTAAENNASYDRAKFVHWADVDRDCQNTRAEVLVSESGVVPTFTSAGRCTVAKGSWRSPWDGASWTLASDVDADHHVALAEAWGSGARSWTAEDRKRYANDLYGPAINAVTDDVNSSKGDRDPAEWLPPRTSTHCAYAVYWVQVKYRWRLSTDATERSRLSGVLSGSCGDRAVTVPARAR